jgi:hypothetical protein
MSVTFNGYHTILYIRFHNDQKLFWVVPRQLTQSVPTLKVTLINHSKPAQICALPASCRCPFHILQVSISKFAGVHLKFCRCPYQILQKSPPKSPSNHPQITPRINPLFTPQITLKSPPNHLPNHPPPPKSPHKSPHKSQSTSIMFAGWSK